MPKQRNHYRKAARAFPRDFPQRLARLQRETGLSGPGLARRLGVDPETVRRWMDGRTRPNAEHLAALSRLAEAHGLERLFTR